MQPKQDDWQAFLQFCRKIPQEALLQEFFELFFTHEEREDFIKRYQIIRSLLQEDITQRQLSDKYKVSIFKVTRGSNALKIISAKLRNFLKKELL